MNTLAIKAALCASAALIGGSALAQTAPVPETEQEGPNPVANADEATQSGEADNVIMVTARRRSERLQDVPVAITAIDGDALVQSGVRDGTDLVKVAPSLSLRDNAGRRDVIIFELRGISAGDVLLPQDPGVAVYVNDFVHARPYGLQGSLYDLESVQVLYGPQGTLFGRNSTAGAVLINTKKPSTDGVSGEARAAFGNYDRREFMGAINLPIGEQVAFRIAGEVKKRDGYTRDLTNNRRLDNQDQRAFRFSSLLKPFDGFTNVTVIDYFKSNTNGSGNKLIAARAPGTCDPEIQRLTGICNVTATFATFLPGVAAAVADSAAIGPRRTRSNVPDQFSEQKVTSIVNTTTLEVTDDVTLKNIIGYLKFDAAFKADLDGSAIPGLATQSFTEGDQWSNEFQVQADLGTVDAIFGAYYFKEDGRDVAFSNAFSPAPIGFRVFNAATTITEAGVTNISKSLFGQATWHVTPALSLTAGARYTWDTRKAEPRGRIPSPLAPGNPAAGLPPGQQCLVFDANNVRLPFNACARPLEKKFSDPSYTLSVDYKVTDDVLVYAAHRRGYRSGGFNPRGVNNATLVPFNPEKIQDFEVGLKSQFHLGDMRTRFNAAAFYAKYDDIQRTVAILINGVPATSVVNAASGKIKGGEAALTIEPFRGLTLGANVSYVDFKIGDFPDVVTNSAIVVPPGTANPCSIAGRCVPVVVSGLQFPISKWQYGLNATYNRELGELGNITAVFNYKWKSKRAGQLSFPFVEPESRVPSSGIADASLRLSEIAGTPIFAGVFVENLFDKTVLNEGLTIQRTFGLTSATYAPPRFYGFEIGAKF